ncbi:small acid-soluble spore protein Tlp [Metabacillus sp. GX 13764]|uniref:small acid-soluble spore protein Tlp n=1 Tax=Metabacillus kandeliae TaxID=2900151 RepID=UPI001E65AED2|nr:small acid-soluble spore protein Tlp [Metabacillus kandeliae]MCD7033649.1 small acid-soluble spore protein Tlp [Metabacillus kandeliae]
MNKQNKPNPDNRTDNVEKLQDMVQNTIMNIEKSHETMQCSTEEEREAIMAKNARREDSLAAMRSEIKDEAHARETGYREDEQR